MDNKNKRILEALKMQPLSQEEMTARHILGRLYGPIATCVESTRNGRLYNKPLWEKALEDDIFLEKVATKALFLELGHPADREETDMKQACACIPEVPKIVGDDLYAYVDILDTPNGRLLKTLVDYGFVPGISSRGSGDVMDNNQVDPETFFLETWDIVQLPAVKKARLNVYESLDSNSVKLKKALAESYRAAKEEDKDTMKKALENLNIDIEETLAESKAVSRFVDDLFTVSSANDPDGVLFTGTEAECAAFVDERTADAPNLNLVITKGATVPVVEDLDDDIPWAEETEEEMMHSLNEEMPADDDQESDGIGEIDDDVEEESDEENSESENIKEISDEEESEESEESEEKIVDVNAAESIEFDTVGNAISMLKEYDDDMRVEFSDIEIDGVKYKVDNIKAQINDSGENKILVLGVNCGEAEENSDDADEDIEAIEFDDEESADVTNDAEEVKDSDDAGDDEESAEDDGDVEVIESLKEMVRQKEALETEVKSLRKAKTVGDAKEQELQEKLLKYRHAFKNTSAEAAKVPELQAAIQKLTEQLTQSKSTIKKLTEKVNNTQQLKESLAGNKERERQLNEEVSKLNKKSDALEAKLEGQTKLYKEKLEERTNLAKTYKARFIETLNRYVESKANMLSIKPSEITSRLNENFTLADVDAVCDQILESTVNFGRLPFGGRSKTSARISESVSKSAVANARTNPEYGYDIDDSLLELAGLK